MKLYYVEKEKEFLLSFSKIILRTMGDLKVANATVSPMNKAWVYEQNHSGVFKASKRDYKTIQDILK